ncbi:hypothetical protein HK44_021360 [Pseudomonas fluorescens HK44]|uniref:Uncharacterized protein n=1 Tax=Pseudomonas fluorescens HK44 TaxID=1042209 RepID=A0A010TGX0_PSEFL|nr:hypothetical protein HK44_021360 [Pseudomonas fluorescens HK44]
MCRRQRKPIERISRRVVAESIARSQEYVVHGIAHARIEHGRNRDLNDLLEQIALREFRYQFDEGVASISNNGHELVFRADGGR